jgi:hypothetical protein
MSQFRYIHFKCSKHSLPQTDKKCNIPLFVVHILNLHLQPSIHIFLFCLLSTVACTINILRSSYDDRHEWCLWGNCVLDFTLALASVINYDRKWCHNMEHHYRVIIYNRNMSIIQAIDQGINILTCLEEFCAKFNLSVFLFLSTANAKDQQVITWKAVCDLLRLFVNLLNCSYAIP